MTGDSDLGQEMDICKSRRRPMGSGKPLPWSFGPHVAVNK